MSSFLKKAAGAAINPIAAGTGYAASRLLGGGGNSTTIDQVPLRTPEQIAAQQALLGYGLTGTGLPGFSEYTGDLGDFNETDLEKSGISKLTGLVNGGRPGIFDAGQNTVNDFLTSDKYNPLAAGGEYQPFKDELARNLQEETGNLKNSLAFSGGLYSTNTGKQVQNLNARAGNDLSSKLASLYSNYTNQKLNAASQAGQFAQEGQNLDLGLVDASQRYGGLSRDLTNAGDQSKLAAFYRSQQPRLQALQGVAGAGANYGVPSLTVPSPDPLQGLVNTGLQAGLSFLTRGASTLPGINGGGSSVPQGYSPYPNYNRLSLN